MYAVILGSPSARQAERRPDAADRLGVRPVRALHARPRGRAIRNRRRCRSPRTSGSSSSPPTGASRLVRLGDGSQFVERVVAPEMVELSRSARARSWARSSSSDGDEEVARVDLVAARRYRRAELPGACRLVRRPRARRGRRHARRGHPGALAPSRMIVTVTLNAAIDRTLVVPNFQPGQRHRASVGFPSAGGKGINVARALKRLGAPVVCTGLAGGRTGTLLVEELTHEGILNDFVRIGAESRTSIAVLDPTSNEYTEINEWGPGGDRGGARDPAREARVPGPARGVRRARRLAAARGRRRASTASSCAS